MGISSVKRMIKDRCPVTLFPIVGTTYTVIHPKRDRSFIRQSEVGCKARNLKTGHVVWYPTVKHGTRVASASRRKFDRYSYPEFVTPDEGDVIIDVGAFVGEFTMAIAEVAEKVVAIEPDPRNVKCLERNVDEFENVTIIEAVVSDTSDERTFQLGSDPTENSLLAPDNDQSQHSQTVSTITLEDICLNEGIESIDYLKVDAEGAEPEVIEGIGSIDIRKITIDAGPERAGETTTSVVRNKLNEQDYETRVVDDVVFARHKS